MTLHARDVDLVEEDSSSEERAELSRRQAIALGVAGAASLLLEGCGVDSVTPPTSPAASPTNAGGSASAEPTAPADKCEAVLQLKREGIRKVDERTETQTIERPPQRFTRVLAVERDFRPNYLLGSPRCEGQCSKNEGGKCEISLTFAWTITVPPGTRAAITAGANSEKVTVRWTGNGTATINLSVTLQCLCDGKPSGAPVTRTSTITSNVNVFA